MSVVKMHRTEREGSASLATDSNAATSPCTLCGVSDRVYPTRVDASCYELISMGCLALSFGGHFIFCTFHLTKLVLITLIDAFFAPRHTLVASRQPLTRVLFPDVKGLLFLFVRKVLVFDQIVGVL